MALSYFACACTDEEAAALARDIQGVTDAVAAVEALFAACERRGPFAFELDAFRFDDDDIPELAAFLAGGGDGALDLPFNDETGVPAASHLTAAAATALAGRLSLVDDRSRVPATRPVLGALRRCLAAHPGRGFIAFTC